MPSLPAHRSDGTNNVSTTTYTKDEASEITYTAPPGTDRIEFKFTEYLHSDNTSWIMLYILCIDDVEIAKTETLERPGQYAVGAYNLTATITSNDIDLTQSHKYYFKLKHGVTHPFKYAPLEDQSGPIWGLQSNDGFIPKLKITAIGESSGQAVTLTNNSVNDLSDISFNSTTTTDGQALVWNSTDGVWESGYAPRTTLTQVITTNIPPEWTQITASSGTPNANSSHAGTIHDDYFYVFAGGNVNNLMYKFHLTTRVWSQVSYSTSGTIPSELYGNLMFSYGNYVYSVFGSRHVSGYPSTNTVLRYDTTNNTLYEVSTSGTTVPTRQAGAIALYNDNGTDYLYYFGGRGSSFYNNMYRLNLSNHSWSSVTTTGGPPDTRYYISHTYTSTKLYIYGGDRSSGDHANDTWEFDLTNNTWTQLQDGTGTAPQGSYGAAMVYNNNNLYIFGGSKTTSGDITDEIWKFDLSDNTWTQLSLSTTPGTKYSPAYATDSSNNLYIHGGYNASYVSQSTIWKLTFSESTSVTTNYIQGLDVNGDVNIDGKLDISGYMQSTNSAVSIPYTSLDVTHTEFISISTVTGLGNINGTTMTAFVYDSDSWIAYVYHSNYTKMIRIKAIYQSNTVYIGIIESKYFSGFQTEAYIKTNWESANNGSVYPTISNGYGANVVISIFGVQQTAFDLNDVSTIPNTPNSNWDVFTNITSSQVYTVNNSIDFTADVHIETFTYGTSNQSSDDRIKHNEQPIINANSHHFQNHTKTLL